MSKKNIIVGIDVGSSNVRCIIVQAFSDVEIPRIIGVGEVPSSGIRRGIISDVEEVIKNINESVEKAERMAGVTVKSANVNIGGTEINFQNSKGVIAVGRADGEVTEDDLERVIVEAQNVALPLNKEIIYVIPKNYRLDDQENIRDPLGMKGVRLEMNALVIECSSGQVKNLTRCIHQSGIDMDEIILEPLAAAESVLGRKQKELGVVLIDIGGGTTGISVFEDGDLVHTAVLPIGAGHVTNDIAIGLRTSIEVAEKVKLEFGNAISEEVGKKEEIDLSEVDSQESGVVSRYHVAEIIEARLEEIFGMVNRELKNIGKAGLLPAGAIITGGGAKLPQLVDLAKNVLGLPAQIGFPINLGGIMNKVDDPSFSTVVGLVIWNEEQKSSLKKETKKVFGNMSNTTEETVKKMKKWMEKFLP
ncbi:MAG: cell division protein FtsA [Parcubacteria group bacterium]|jgi:cell division protein FtsA